MQTSSSHKVGCERESMQESLPSQELRDFIQRVIVPILVDRHVDGRNSYAKKED